MKKHVLVLALLVVSAAMSFAAGPKYFAFTIGAGGAFDINSGNIVAGNEMGFTYSFNNTFAGGFSFTDINGVSIDMVNIAVSPIDNATLSMYSGQVGAGVFGFGVGLGYNFFAKSETLFTALGIYLDWFAGNGGTYDIANGGVFTFGLRSQVGM